MAALSPKALQALTDYDEARVDYMRFLSMDTPDDKAVHAAMVAMDEAHIRFKQEMGDFDAPPFKAGLNGGASRPGPAPHHCFSPGFCGSLKEKPVPMWNGTY